MDFFSGLCFGLPIGLAAGYAFRWKQTEVIAFVDSKVSQWFKRS